MGYNDPKMVYNLLTFEPAVAMNSIADSATFDLMTERYGVVPVGPSELGSFFNVSSEEIPPETSGFVAESNMDETHISVVSIAHPPTCTPFYTFDENIVSAALIIVPDLERIATSYR